MVFANQFALSLEVTNAVPQIISVVGSGYEMAMKLARELQVGPNFSIPKDSMRT